MCAELEPGSELPALTAEGSLRLEDDLGWTTCPRGHRIRVIRAGAPTSVARPEATAP